MSSPPIDSTIGTPGVPWGEAEKKRWRSQQTRKRSYDADVVKRLAGRPGVEQYGALSYEPGRFPLLAIRPDRWRDDLPSALVTGGVHGYETSGVLGALQFIEAHAANYAGRVNLLVTPCVSPWAWEHIHRWNPNAVDPNRSFFDTSEVEEAAALIKLIAPQRERFLLHIDLHETTDSDESQFRPALAARDGKKYELGTIPDGFYLVGDSENPQPAFQAALIAAVERVTHIAAADERGEMIGSPIAARGVINYPFRKIGLCAGVTRAAYTTTTEVYPDSPRATPEQCNVAQVAAVCAALDFIVSNGAWAKPSGI